MKCSYFNDVARSLQLLATRFPTTLTLLFSFSLALLSARTCARARARDSFVRTHTHFLRLLAVMQLPSLSAYYIRMVNAYLSYKRQLAPISLRCMHCILSRVLFGDHANETLLLLLLLLLQQQFLPFSLFIVVESKLIVNGVQ